MCRVRLTRRALHWVGSGRHPRNQSCWQGDPGICRSTHARARKTDPLTAAMDRASALRASAGRCLSRWLDFAAAHRNSERGLARLTTHARRPVMVVDERLPRSRVRPTSAPPPGVGGISLAAALAGTTARNWCNGCMPRHRYVSGENQNASSSWPDDQVAMALPAANDADMAPGSQELAKRSSRLPFVNWSTLQGPIPHRGRVRAGRRHDFMHLKPISRWRPSRLSTPCKKR